MIQQTRAPFTKLAILLASATALLGMFDISSAQAKGMHGDRAGRPMVASQDRKHAAKQTTEKRKTKSVECFKAPCSIVHDQHVKKRYETAEKKQQGCGKLIVPTAHCPTPARDPVGNTRPALPQEAKQPTTGARKPVQEYIKPLSATEPAKAPTAVTSSVTVSNGVSRIPIDAGKGLTVSSSGNGINVANGTTAVTLAGGSVTLHGATTLTAGPGVQVVRLGNGDYSVAVKPLPAVPDKAPPGVTLADDASFVGRNLSKIPASTALGVTAVVGAPIAAAVGAIEGHPAKTLDKYLDSVGKELTDVFEW